MREKVNALKTIMGRSSGDEQVNSIQKQLDALIGEGAAATNELEKLTALKLKASNFDDAEQIDRATKKQEWIANRAAKQVPELRERLKAAKVESQRRAIVSLKHEWLALYRAHRTSIKAAAESQAKANEFYARACREIGEHAAALHLPAMPYRGLLVDEFVDIWTAEMDRVANAVEHVDNPKILRVAPATRTKSVASPRAASKAAPKVDPTPARRPQVRIEDDLAVLGSDQVRVIVLHPGYADQFGVQSHVGRKIRLSRRVAEMAARNGAVEILKE